VYAEMPLFAERMGRTSGDLQTATEATVALRTDAPAPVVAAAPRVRTRRLRRALRAVVASRMTWFAAGTFGGVLGALLLTAYVAATQVHGARTLVVAPDGRAAFATIGEALAAGRPGDVVRVEPGVYREHVAVADGVDLVARVPGTVTIVHTGDPGTPAVSIAGTFNVRVSGIRIDAQTPLDVGVRVAAPAATLEMMEIAGPIRQAIGLAAGSAVTTRGSRIAVEHTLAAVPDEAHATFVDSILTRTTPAAEPALSISPSAHLVLRGNAFAGFGAEIVDGVTAARRAELLAGNIVVGSGR
jgi:hypothetical protein